MNEKEIVKKVLSGRRGEEEYFRAGHNRTAS